MAAGVNIFQFSVYIIGMLEYFDKLPSSGMTYPRLVIGLPMEGL